MVTIREKPSRFFLNIAGALTFGYTDSQEVRNRMRQAAIHAAREALSVRSLPFRRANLSPAVVIAPHPDDETLGCGGTIALLAQASSRVHVVFVSDGSASHPRHPLVAPEEMAARRRVEAIEATSTLGVESAEVSFMGAPDGKLSTMGLPLQRTIVTGLASLLKELEPKAIFLPCRNDGSTEHSAVFRLVLMALNKARSKPRILEYPIWAWRNPHLLITPMLLSKGVWSVDISAVVETKVAAMDLYASQLRPIPPDKHPALPSEFVAEFMRPVEYFFER